MHASTNRANVLRDGPEASPRTAHLSDSRRLGAIAAWALREEALLTPKPGLVDCRGAGAHADMNLAMLLRSAAALEPHFFRIAECAATTPFSLALRSRLGIIGREAETAMLANTHGVNTHRGAIWALGLLVAGRASLGAGDAFRARSQANSENADSPIDARAICDRAARIARMPTVASTSASHGRAMQDLYGARGARGEAHAGFPRVHAVALPALRAGRLRYRDESRARTHALISLIAGLDDTCLLYRGGPDALAFAQRGARRLLACGLDSEAGKRALRHLDDGLLARNASPGGSADLLAATLLLDRIECLTETTDGNA